VSRKAIVATGKFGVLALVITAAMSPQTIAVTVIQGDRDCEVIVEADGSGHGGFPDTPTLAEFWFIPEKR
jgi:hypothetical protein